MEAASSSSKVTVEYHDPSGIFPLLSRDLSLRLPLRNLNWQSPSRPLRQIKSLHVDFVPDRTTELSLRPPQKTAETDAPTSFEILRAGAVSPKAVVRERRHQIPGLKKSPFLRIYILRCDDKDSYKDVERKKIREWIRENSVSESHRDQHDASEWLILHVVMPDTVASSEPRWREGNSKESDEIKERPKSNAKWPGKSTKTVFDRLRADFNDSGKTSLDRVAQIRLLKSQVPPDLLPTPAVAPTLEETTQERENAWADLITKFKILLLGPFDLRVRQYEQDIAEQEARRSFPGWNFCTFFIHKEGLAKALESIGLVEDALAIYDELSLGLETVLRDLASGQAEGTATSFATLTDDILERLLDERDPRTTGMTNGETETKKGMAPASKLFDKDYRERIVTSNISVFDFFGYIFSRQRDLLLRLANARSARVVSSSADKDTGEDLVLTSEVCWRASSFIPNSARALRQELATRHQTSAEWSDLTTESLVCSWTFAIAAEVLEDTAAPALLDVVLQESKNTRHLPNGSPKRPSLSTGLGANPYPQRTTSLTGRRFTLAHAQGPSVRPRTLTLRSSQPPQTSGTDLSKPLGLPGQPELATYRAELILMQRRMLERLAQYQGWYAGWAFIRHQRITNLELSQGIKGEHEALSNDQQLQLPIKSLSATLRTAIASPNTFQSAYEDLTDQAIRHYFAATQAKSIETLVGDIAILRYQQGDFVSSATYLQHTVKSLATSRWDMREYEALHAYATTLQELERSEDFVETAATLLSKVCARKFEEPEMPCSSVGPTFSTFDRIPDTKGLLTKAADVSLKLPHPKILTLDKYFAQFSVDPQILHHGDCDGFSLQIEFFHVMDDELEIDEVKVKLISTQDSLQEIWLTNTEVGAVKRGRNIVLVKSVTTTSGLYELDQVAVDAKKLRFLREFRPKPSPTALGILNLQDTADSSPLLRPIHVHVYPAPKALSLEVQQSDDILVGKRRSISVHLSAGRNEISHSDMKVKPMSAGLRLHLADAQLSGCVSSQRAGVAPGISIGAIQARTEAIITIPYSMEQSHKEISLRFEVHYETPHGSFVLLYGTKVSHELPLDVDVNDSFHTNAVLSSFSLRTTGNMPFTVLDATLHGSDVYSVSTPPLASLPAAVFTSQPLGLIFRITRKSSERLSVAKKDAALALKVQYRAVDELLMKTIRRLFSHDLEQSQFASLSGLLEPLFATRVKALLSVSNMELAALLDEATVPGFEAIGWDEFVGFLPNASVLQGWLRQWHSEHSAISISKEDNEAAAKCITISVDVPTVDVVFSASLSLSPSSYIQDDSLPVLTLGNTFKASLRVKHTNQWSAKNLYLQNLRTKGSTANGEDWRFVFSAGTDTDAWLIGGQRRCHFNAERDGEKQWTLLLIPLRLGRHRLPRIEVQLAPPARASADVPLTHELALSCATHYESIGQSVQVIRDQRSSRIHIAEASSHVSWQSSTRPGTAAGSEIG